MKLIQLVIYQILATPIHFLFLPFSFLSLKFFRSFRLSSTPKVDGKILICIPSVGELEYVRPILKNLQNQELCLAYFSPSYEKFLDKNSQIFKHQFKLQIDSLFSIFQLFKLNPKLIIFGRMQIWPMLLWMMEKRKVPLIMVSGNFKGQSLNSLVKRLVYKPWLRIFDKIFLEDEDDLIIAKTMNLQNTLVSGNPRVDQVLNRFENKGNQEWIVPWIDKPILVLASVWESDLKIIWQDVLQLIQQNKFKVIFVPHEYHVSRDPHGVSFFYSKDRKIDLEKYICVVNEVGILFDLYQYANYVYVGGGFGRDVHSTLEPAAFGLPLFFGPNIKRSGEAKNFVKIGGAKIIQKPLDLKNSILNLEISGAKNIEDLMRNKGATQKIETYLNSEFGI